MIKKEIRLKNLIMIKKETKKNYFREMGGRDLSLINIEVREFDENGNCVKIYTHDLEITAKTDEFSFADGQVTYSADSSKSESFKKLVERIIMFPINLPPGEVGGLESTAFFEAEKPLRSVMKDELVLPPSYIYKIYSLEFHKVSVEVSSVYV